MAWDFPFSTEKIPLLFLFFLSKNVMDFSQIAKIMRDVIVEDILHPVSVSWLQMSLPMLSALFSTHNLVTHVKYSLMQDLNSKSAHVKSCLC